MALYRVQLRKAVNEGGILCKFSNIYYTNADNVIDAADFGIFLWNTIEKGMHRPFVFCYEVYASDLDTNTTNYTVAAIPPENQRGTLTVDSGQVLPLFNVLRVDLNVVGGRPSRKYYRPMLGENDQAGGVINNVDLVTALTGKLQLLVNLVNLVDESGNDIASFSIKGITSRRLGKFSALNVPTAPPQG